MEKKYVIILSEGKEYLCCHEDGCYYDVSCPMRSFTEGEEDFEIMDSGQNRHPVKSSQCFEEPVWFPPERYQICARQLQDLPQIVQIHKWFLHF